MVVAGWLVVVVVVVVVVVGAGVDVSLVPLLATGAAVGGGAGVTTGGVWLLNTSGDGNSQHQVPDSLLLPYWITTLSPSLSVRKACSPMVTGAAIML